MRLDTWSDSRVDIASAARQLGCSSEAVRKRIKRGLLRAEHCNGRVLVWLPADPPSENGHRADHGPAMSGLRSDTGPTLSDPELDPRSDMTRALIEQLQGEVAFLRAALQAEQERVREAHLLLAQRPALPPVEPMSVNSTVNAPAHPWWAALLWWRRGR